MNCEKCGTAAKVTDIGSASGRKTWRCPGCGATWREKAEKNPAAVALGALGGRARAEAMSQEERSASASAAASAKWAREKTDPVSGATRGMFAGKVFSR